MTLRVGWVVDDRAPVIGGADLCVDDLVEAKPGEVEIVPCPSRNIDPTVDLYAVHNVVSYNAEAIKQLAAKPVVKLVYEQWWVGDDILRAWLLENAEVAIFLSQPHLDQFPWPVKVPTLIQPTIHNHLDRFDPSRWPLGDRERAGVMWMAQMTGAHKGLPEAVAWAETNEQVVDFYGDGHIPKPQSRYAVYKGEKPPAVVPSIMAEYERFLFLPTVLDVCSRTIFEAHRAGLDLVVNENVGALWWLDNEPDAIGTGAARFWNTILDHGK